MTVEERAADMVEFFGVPKDYRGTATELTAWLAELIREQVREAVAAERERCAQVCERTHEELDAEFSPEGCTDSASVAADRIRSGE